MLNEKNKKSISVLQGNPLRASCLFFSQKGSRPRIEGKANGNMKKDEKTQHLRNTFETMELRLQNRTMCLTFIVQLGPGSSL